MTSFETAWVQRLGSEERLLISLCSRELLNRDAECEPLTTAIDWLRLVQIARDNRVVPLLWRALQQQSAPEVPPHILGDLRDGYRENAISSLRLLDHLFQVTQALAAEGIPAVPLKGVCFAAAWYNGLASRHAGDIDLLIRPSQMDRAHDVLRALGYLRVSDKSHVIVEGHVEESLHYRHHSLFLSRDGVLIELHFTLHNNPYMLPVDVEDIVAQGLRVEVGKLRLPTMPNALQFAYLATHGARHSWSRLQWLCDIALMVDRTSTDEIDEWLAFAARLRVSNPVAQALIMAQRFLHTTVPDAVMRRFARSWRVRYMVRRAEQTLLQASGDKSDAQEKGLHPRRWLYRMCMTGRPRYFWAEFRHSIQALSRRVTG
jgi:hypothetical protein